jgi:transcriptional regulator with XRE-family HTH domain
MKVTISVTVPALGQQIREKRLEAGLQPAQVAAAAGMSVSNLYLIESGKAQALPEETLKRLSEAIGFDFVCEVYRIIRNDG